MNNATETTPIQIKVIINRGNVLMVLKDQNVPVQVEIVPDDPDYADHEELEKYQNELIADPAFMSCEFSSADFTKTMKMNMKNCTKGEIINVVWERISTQLLPRLEKDPHIWGGHLFNSPLTEPYPAGRFSICVNSSRESSSEKKLHIYLTTDTDGVISFSVTTLEKASVVEGLEKLFAAMDDYWDDESLRAAWEFFGDIPMDANECMEEPFLHFPSGTHREEIWHWFDKHYSEGVHALLYPHEHL